MLSFRLLVHRLGCLDSAGNVTVVYITVPEALPEPDAFLSIPFSFWFGQLCCLWSSSS